MEKIITLGLVGAILTACSTTAFAAQYPGRTQNTEITTTVAPTFTVSIPADTTVQFNALSNDFGAVTLDTARLEPNKMVKVTVSSDFELNNSLDDSAVIPYTLTEEVGTAVAQIINGTSMNFTAVGESRKLSIHITQNDWDAAAAGDYSDTVTFNIAYVDADV